MDVYSQTAFLAALITVGIATGVLLRAADRRLALLFAVFAGNVAFWHLCELLYSLSLGAIFLGFWMASISTLPLTAHRFFFAFFTRQTVSLEVSFERTSTRRVEKVLWLGAMSLALVSMTPLVEYLALRAVVVAWAHSAIGLLLWRIQKQAVAIPSRIERGRLAYLVLGGLVAMAFTAIGLLPFVSALVPSIGKAAVVIYLYLLSQAILRHRLLDLNELLAKLLVLSGAALVLGLVFGLIVLWAGEDRGLIVLNVLLVSFAMMALFEPLRSRFEHHVLGTMFAERALLRRVLEGLRREVPGIIDPAFSAEHILERLYETGRVTHASVYLLAENEAGYHRVSFRGPEPPAWLDGAAVREVAATAASGHKAVLRETVERRLHQSRRNWLGTSRDEVAPEPEEIVKLKSLLSCLDRISSGVLLPIVGGGRVVGLLSLHDERLYEAYSTNEIGALIVVADLMATVVENSRIYERMKERDRLAALGEMSAGLAHEIRNPLGAIKAAAQYLEPGSLSGEERELLEVIIEEVDRLNGVVAHFLDYARPLKLNLVPTDVGEVVRRTIKLLEQRDIPEDVEVILDLAESLPSVEADPEQLRQVVFNLVLNAVQAMEGKGTLTLATRLEEASEPGGGPPPLILSVTDSGPGISPSVKDSVFIPFFTTKEGGTGLGLPISQRIVESHGGRIEVHSREGHGTEFRVCLSVTSPWRGE